MIEWIMNFTIHKISTEDLIDVLTLENHKGNSEQDNDCIRRLRILSDAIQDHLKRDSEDSEGSEGVKTGGGCGHERDAFACFHGIFSDVTLGGFQDFVDPNTPTGAAIRDGSTWECKNCYQVFVTLVKYTSTLSSHLKGAWESHLQNMTVD